VVSDNVCTLPPVSLITIPSNTALVCDRFSISSLPTPINSSLLQPLDNKIFNLYEYLSNDTRWEKLPYIPDHLQAVIDFITKNPTPASIHPIVTWYCYPFSYVTLLLLVLIIALLGFLIYCRFVRPPAVPTVHLELPTIS
jgi:hypothetical protein